MPDTRDIAIRTATKLEGLEQKLDAALEAIADLKADLNQRRGAEKLARALHTFFGGGIGAGAILIFSKLTGIPLPR